MSRIYLDYNASTPIALDVQAAMLPYLAEHYGNPSSQHWAGAPARVAVERARNHLANLLGSSPTEIVFTRGGTEANNAQRRICRSRTSRPSHYYYNGSNIPPFLLPVGF